MSQRTGAQSVDIWTNTEIDGTGTNYQPIFGGFQIPYFDYISLSYSGDNVTQLVYKVGGASGTVVSTLDLTYSGDNVASITKS
jgi:hypothetical protein